MILSRWQVGMKVSRSCCSLARELEASTASGGQSQESLSWSFFSGPMHGGTFSCGARAKEAITRDTQQAQVQAAGLGRLCGTAEDDHVLAGVHAP